MDFNLKNEYDQLYQYSKTGQSTLSSFCSFIKVIHKQNDKSMQLTKKALDIFIKEVLKEENQSSLVVYIVQFYSSFNQYLNQLQLYNNKIANELINPLNQFMTHLSSKQSEALESLKEIINSTLTQKKQYEFFKSNYFLACKASQSQEKLVIQSLDNKEKQLGTDRDVEQAHDELYKLRSIAEDNYLKYKNEHKLTNVLYENNNSKYFPCMEKIKNIEESREAFIKFHFEKLIQLFKTNSSILTNLIKQITEKNIEIKPDEDIKLFKEKTKYFINEQKRFPFEELINYDIYRRNVESLITKNNILLQQEKGSEFEASHDFFIRKVTDLNCNYLLIKEEKDILDSFFSNIGDINEESILFIELNKKLRSNYNIAKNVIDYFLDNYYSKELMININNENQFSLLALLFSSIISNSFLHNNVFEINFAIIYIAEKTFYEIKNNLFEKIYMCSLLSQQIEKYRSKEFWEKLLKIKIETTILSKAKGHLVKFLKQEKEPIISPNTSSFTLSMFNSIINIGKSIYKVKDEAKYHQDILDKIIHKIRAEVAFNVIKDFIPHFSFFNVDSTDIVNIITQVSVQYQFTEDKNKIHYLIAIVKSNKYSIKNSKTQKTKNKDDTFFIINESNININDNKIINKNYLKKERIKDKTLAIILNSMKYLKNSDHISIMCLNKYYMKSISTIYYKNVLTQAKNNVSNHIKIWKQLLNCSQNKNAQLYTNSIKDLKKINKEIFELIKMDVDRTSFPNDIIENDNRNKLYKILCLSVVENPLISYCQGMNYIAAFLLHYTQNEEESYNIFNSLLNRTEYSDLFTNELHRMKKYFFVFERLIFIFMPELFYYLKTQSVSVTYYISPWFITLFTNAFQYIEPDQTPEIFVWILDLFILDGWKAIIKIGLCLMKHYEKKLLNLKYEELLYFLVNDILKYDFFQTYDRLHRTYSQLKIQNSLFSNLEKEYDIKLEIE